jgi:hypothetical protein
MSWKIPKRRPHPKDEAISSLCQKLACYFGDAHTDAGIGELIQDFGGDPWAMEQFQSDLAHAIDTPDYDRVWLLRACANRNTRTDDEARKWLLMLSDALSSANVADITFRKEFAYYFRRESDDDAAILNLRGAMEESTALAEIFLQGIVRALHDDAFDRGAFLRETANRQVADDTYARAWLQNLETRLFPTVNDTSSLGNAADVMFREKLCCYLYGKSDDEFAILDLREAVEKSTILAEIFLQGIVRALHDDAFDRVAFLREAAGRQVTDDRDARAWFQHLETKLFSAPG